MLRIAGVLAPALVWLLAGCAATPTPRSGEGGAWLARIVAVYEPGAVAAGLPPCLAALAPEDYAARRFVRFRYRLHRAIHDEVAELAPLQEARVGDRLEVWPVSCDGGAISRAGRVLAPR